MTYDEFLHSIDFGEFIKPLKDFDIKYNEMKKSETKDISAKTDLKTIYNHYIDYSKPVITEDEQVNTGYDFRTEDKLVSGGIFDTSKYDAAIKEGIRDPRKTLIIEKQEVKEGLRFNEGKTRYDLIPSYPVDQLAQVLTKGAEKYAPRNWEKGMPWSKITASLKRHLGAIEKGEDFDKETGLLHASHVLCNAAFLVEYYKTHPEFDDRPHNYLTPKKIGLDLDDVIVGFMEGFGQRFGYDTARSWNFTYDMNNHFNSLFQSEEAHDFFMNLHPAISPDDLPFEPTCYITARSVPNEWNKEWLQRHGFPTVPVHTIPFNASKVDVAKEAGIDYFIDDRYENFVELNKAGICTFLWDKPHNQRYNVGYKRIKSFEDFKNRFL